MGVLTELFEKPVYGRLGSGRRADTPIKRTKYGPPGFGPSPQQGTMGRTPHSPTTPGMTTNSARASRPSRYGDHPDVPRDAGGWYSGPNRMVRMTHFAPDRVTGPVEIHTMHPWLQGSSGNWVWQTSGHHEVPDEPGARNLPHFGDVNGEYLTDAEIEMMIPREPPADPNARSKPKTGAKALTLPDDYDPTQASRYADNPEWEFVEAGRIERAKHEQTLRELHAERADQMQRKHDETLAELNHGLATGLSEDDPIAITARATLDTIRKHIEDRRLLAAGKPTKHFKYQRPNSTRYMTTEDDFHRALDENPNDHQTRMVFADWLQEHDDPRAEGYRALGMLARRPEAGGHGVDSQHFWGNRDVEHHLDNDKKYAHTLLPGDWFHQITPGVDTHGTDYWRLHNNRRQAEDEAALAFSFLGPERKQQILNPEPTQSARYQATRYMTSEEDFHRLLDANHDDHQTRMIFADWLQERGDPRAEGYRALGQLGLRPVFTKTKRSVWGSKKIEGHLADEMMPHQFDHYRPGLLHHDWMDLIPASGVDNQQWWRGRNTRREADDAAAHAFSLLSPQLKQEILNPPPEPTQSSRYSRSRPTRYMTSEEDFHRQLDENPHDHQTRGVFADWLEERGDPRAEGYRALAAIQAIPSASDSAGTFTHSAIPAGPAHHWSYWGHGPRPLEGRSRMDADRLPNDWLRLVPQQYPPWGTEEVMRGAMSRRDLDDAAAHAFSQLPEHRRQQLLNFGQPPTQSSRYSADRPEVTLDQFPDAVETDPRHLRPINEVIPEKSKGIEENMRENGWTGYPLLAVGNQALVGSHRLDAAMHAGLTVPVVFLDSGDFLEAAKRVHAIKPEINPHTATFGDIMIPDDEARLKIVTAMKHPLAIKIMQEEMKHNAKFGGKEGWERADWAPTGGVVSPEGNYARGKKPTRYMTTEDDFHRALDENPDDHQTRMVFADWLQERDDPRAEGYRMMGMTGKYPRQFLGNEHSDPTWYWGTTSNESYRNDPFYRHAMLDEDWMHRTPHTHPGNVPNFQEYWRHAPTRREADNNDALAFSQLPDAIKKQIAGSAEPTQASRYQAIRYMTTEDDFHKQLDEHPDDHQTRMVFADWLQERDDPRAEGYRALGQLRIPPWFWKGSKDWGYWQPLDRNDRHTGGTSDTHASVLPGPWYDSIPPNTGGRHVLVHPTRREAEDTAAHHFSQLPPAVKQQLLNPEPTQSARYHRLRYADEFDFQPPHAPSADPPAIVRPAASGKGPMHAPPGGTTSGGKFYPGGEFIPKEAVRGASPPKPAAGSGDDPFDVSPHLTPDEQRLERESQEYVRKHFTMVKSKYLKKNATFGADGFPVSVTLNTDEWRELIPGYTGTNSGAIHEAASWANKMLYKEALTQMRGKGNNKVMVLAGGGGSGKGTATGDFLVQSEYPIVLDQVSDNARKLADKFREAKANGFESEYVFVDRPPQGAAQGIIGRALNMRKEGQVARTVDIAHGLKANIAARRVALEVIRNHPEVPVSIIDNRGEHEGSRYNRQMITDRNEAAAYLERRLAEDEAALAGGLETKIRDSLVARHAAGEVPDDLMDGFLSSNWRSTSPATPQALPHARYASRATPVRYRPPPGSTWPRSPSPRPSGRSSSRP